MRLIFLRQHIIAEDVGRILNIKILMHRGDEIVWLFSKDGAYPSKSGYSLIETLQSYHCPSSRVVPPIEKNLWNKVWKFKTSPKIRHFLWRALSWALAVKERLQTHGLHIDSTCNSCDLMVPKSICHVLFNCQRHENYPTSLLPPQVSLLTRCSWIFIIY